MRIFADDPGLFALDFQLLLLITFHVSLSKPPLSSIAIIGACVRVRRGSCRVCVCARAHVRVCV